MVLIPRSAPKLSFGTRGREAQAPETPGPGHYSGAGEQGLSTSICPRSATWNFGTSGRENRLRQTPGPGAYSQKEVSRRRGPAYSLRPRRPQSRWRMEACDRDAGPGPGSYRTDQALCLNMETPKYSMAGRGSEKATEAPGPGHYGLGSRGAPTFKTRNKPGYGFGTSSREPGKNFCTPGPGQYSLQNSVGAGGPSYSLMAKRSHLESKDMLPGPGAHDLKPNFGE
eukprot:TRINITY_DN15265_c0_g1_i1.p1 TRINITY_DN15265_c0_g1~~TRINITY_DN15265_c0_g1_i1.p1  ORF type:complete len:226 (-),score=12.87 TRINITY_DN15265_c0_g1_i1:280-957(-)